jgi:hypothetical protein
MGKFCSLIFIVRISHKQIKGIFNKIIVKIFQPCEFSCSEKKHTRFFPKKISQKFSEDAKNGVTFLGCFRKWKNDI